jgi:fumarate reductase subunit C
MTSPTNYTPYHPRWYRRRMSVWWWLGSWRYAKFMLRELTCVAVGYFAMVELYKIRALGNGPDAYVQFLERMQSPLFLVLNTMALLLIVFHAVTWFSLAPKAMPVRLGGKRVPDAVIVATNYVAWIVISAILVWLS